MIEVDTTYSWQMPCSIDAQEFCASVPASLFRTQSEFDLAWVNIVSASKQNSPPSADAQAACCFTQQKRVSSFPLKQQLSLSGIRSTLSRPDFWPVESFNYIQPTWVSPYPCRPFFTSEKHFSVHDSSIS